MSGEFATRFFLSLTEMRLNTLFPMYFWVAHWFEQAAASGDLVAAFNLGLCLDKGVGVEPDAQQAVHWLRRAAEGVPEAQYMYGRMLAHGHGVPADPEAGAPGSRARPQRACARRK